MFLFIYLFIYFKDLFIIYFIYFWLCWVLVAACGIFVEACGIFYCGMSVFSSLVVAHRLQGAWALQLWHAGSRAHGLCSLQHTGSSLGARALQLWYTGLVAPQHVRSQFPDQGSNPRPLHCKADSLPLDHQGSPLCF